MEKIEKMDDKMIELENKKIQASLKTKLIIAFFVLAGFMVFGMICYKYIDVLQDPEYQTFLVTSLVAKNIGGTEFEVECNFDEINSYLSGHYEHTVIPKTYEVENIDLFGEDLNTTKKVMKNTTISKYVPERFDLKGLKGIRCTIKGGILPKK